MVTLHRTTRSDRPWPSRRSDRLRLGLEIAVSARDVLISYFSAIQFTRQAQAAHRSGRKFTRSSGPATPAAWLFVGLCPTPVAIGSWSEYYRSANNIGPQAD